MFPLYPEDNKDLLACVEGSSVAPLLNGRRQFLSILLSRLSIITPDKPPFKDDNEGNWL